jgi:hypothetical protein
MKGMSSTFCCIGRGKADFAWLLCPYCEPRLSLQDIARFLIHVRAHVRLGHKALPLELQ